MRLILFFSGLILISGGLKAQEQPKKFTFLDHGSYFAPIVLDPTEALSSGAVYKLWENQESIKGSYITVNLALHLSLIRLPLANEKGLEFGFEAAAYTQFEIKEVSSGTYLGGIVNTDYRAIGFINYLQKSWAFRLRLFHVSSHLGDDYIIRNDITTPTPNTVNYEQIDVTASYNHGPLRYYAGVGYIFTPNSVRERFSTQLGFYFHSRDNQSSSARLVGGVDVKIFEENNYRPNYRSGIGVEVGKPEKTHIVFLLDYYNGHLPYSTLEYRLVSWLGISGIVMLRTL